jgi:hypothetical protein
MASGNAAELFLLDDGPLPAVANTLTQHEPGQGEQDRRSCLSMLLFQLPQKQIACRTRSILLLKTSRR